MFEQEKEASDSFDAILNDHFGFIHENDQLPPLLDFHLLESPFFEMYADPVFGSPESHRVDDTGLDYKEFQRGHHDLDHILEEIERPRVFQCSFCGKEFFKSTALGGHTSKMHPREKQ